jgi:ABC-type uncharacterized transport system permease subunit
MLWLGFTIGGLVGTMFGIFLAALCQAAGRADKMAGRE